MRGQVVASGPEMSRCLLIPVRPINVGAADGDLRLGALNRPDGWGGGINAHRKLEQQRKQLHRHRSDRFAIRQRHHAHSHLLEIHHGRGGHIGDPARRRSKRHAADPHWRRRPPGFMIAGPHRSPGAGQCSHRTLAAGRSPWRVRVFARSVWQITNGLRSLSVKRRPLNGQARSVRKP